MSAVSYEHAESGNSLYAALARTGTRTIGDNQSSTSSSTQSYTVIQLCISRDPFACSGLQKVGRSRTILCQSLFILDTSQRVAFTQRAGSSAWQIAKHGIHAVARQEAGCEYFL